MGPGKPDYPGVEPGPGLSCIYSSLVFPGSSVPDLPGSIEAFTALDFFEFFFWKNRYSVDVRLSLISFRTVFVCICKAVNDKSIRRAVDEGARCIEDLEQDLGVGSSCGRCRVHAEAVIKDQLNASGPSESPVPFSGSSMLA